MVLALYAGKSGNAGVEAYEIRADAIVLRFKDGATYLYDETRPGRRHVEAMKRLARVGRGLTTYVNRHVRENYAARLDRR
jgi:hypothetical protein